uniref:NADH-ubiquinone oxidoreductase chain 1 n=1 Tax=Myrsidea sp. ADS-2020 TaxID=2794901 RepID=A0A7T1HF15_9NEOP|nr:NADH dehydrogenase subunit 1 [Myrsidea sp. ADS-2020]
MMSPTILILIHYTFLCIMMLIAVGFFSLIERKVLSLIHSRVGPDKVSLSGILQPIADALKLMTKDDFPVAWSNFILFYASPILMFSVSLGTFLIFPFFMGGSQSFSMILLMIFLGMTVYGNLISGWSSNSKYALIGSVRSVSQSLSYEVVFSFFMILIISVMATFDICKFYVMHLTMLGLMSTFIVLMFISVALAELNRTPFDLSEGESELVSGYSVEYGGVMYTLLFLSENVSIFMSCFMISFFFFSKSPWVFPLMWSVWAFILCVLRGALPRLRYDVLMQFCWLSLLPSVLLSFNFILVMIVVIY